VRAVYSLVLACLLAAPAARAEFLPLAEVRPGMKGVGRTVFSGQQIEEFQVEVLGVLKNIGPKQSIILARLSGGQLAKTGVMAGMSGSPVYVDGKLLGAVAFAFPFSTEPIAGIRPIEEMVDAAAGSGPSEARSGRGLVAVAGGPPGDGLAGERAGRSPAPLDVSGDLPARLDLVAALQQPGQQPKFLLPPGPRAIGRDPQLIPIATPVAMAGFSERTLDLFGPSLERLGLRPMQGIGGQSAADPEVGARPRVEPGSMITVGLIRGDLDVSAAGTVTYVDGNRLYAFGHRFLSSGPTEMPMMSSSVVAVVPNLSTSFKIAGSGELLGKIVLDHSTGIAGMLGEKPRLLPLEVSVRSSHTQQHYKLEMVDDPFLSPFLLQMALFSAADATERQVGAASYRVQGSVEFANGLPPLRLDNMFSAPSMAAFQLATNTAVPLAFLMQSGLDNVDVRDIRVDIESLDEEKSLEIDRVWASRTRLRPGETVRLTAALHGNNGEEVLRSVDYEVPLGMKAGDLNINFSDATTLNFAEWQNLFGNGRARELPDLVRAINRLRRNDRLYVRLWRPGRALQVHSEKLPAPPASVASVLSLPAAAGGRDAQDWQSTVEELEIDGLSSVVEGNISMKVTVIE
jgi:SpoIVB peptidase S55